MATQVQMGAETKVRPQLPRSFLNAYELALPSRQPWRVALYAVDASHGQRVEHEDRGRIKSAAWDLYRGHKARCPGPQYFVIDVAADMIAVPATWELPSDIECGGLRFIPNGIVFVNLDEPEHDTITRGLLREGLKRTIKDSASAELGRLWQHYNDFCQVPAVDGQDTFLFCRKFGIEIFRLRGRCWCLQIRVSTQTVDGRTLADYARSQDWETLAEIIELKRSTRLTRRGRAIDVAVLRMQALTNGRASDATRLELDDPDGLIRLCRDRHSGSLPARLADIRCKSLKVGVLDIPPDELRLILDTQITLDEHRETILEPAERVRLSSLMRDILDGSDVLGAPLSVSQSPIDAQRFDHGIVAPPAIRLREGQKETVLVAPQRVTTGSLRARGQERIRSLRRHGFLITRPMNPLLACPGKYFDEKRAERLRSDFNVLLDEQNLPFRFERVVRYGDVHDIDREIKNGQYDSVLAVLPEGSRRPNGSNCIHEQLKRRLTVPSQCIQYDNTFFDRSGAYRITPHAEDLPQRIRNNYVNCIWGLAVKNHFVPFAPAEAFYYDVHVGIDVGGRDNNKAMLCVGYGFQSPRERLIFLADEIPIDGAKAEPIPVDSLIDGVMATFEKLAVHLGRAGRPFSLQRLLFFRDGSLLGDAPRWNERDAFAPIYTKCKHRGWARDGAVWSVVEVSKMAEGWRVLTSMEQVMNPIVGRWVAPFDDPSRVILSTTGAPYLTQGTASPLVLQIGGLVGKVNRDEVLRDVAWEADMCFTKPDMGMKLPWVLYVANEGALQAAKSYEITGVPV